MRLYEFQHDSPQHHASITPKKQLRKPWRHNESKRGGSLGRKKILFTLWDKQACYAAVRCVPAAGSGSIKGAITSSATNVRGVRSGQIGSTRCDDKCENTVYALRLKGPAEVYAGAVMTQ